MSFSTTAVPLVMTGDNTSPRGSIDSSETRASGYTSRFHEHMSQAYTAYPTDWPLPILPAAESNNHKHSQSVESFTSMLSSSTLSMSSTSSSLDRFRRLANKIKSALPNRSRFISVAYNEFTVKGSKKRFRKEDIKMGGLIESSNMMHYI